ncbi:MAG: hypothetical protein M3525_04530 [Acidobacteriota bacterium]|nr:hypothetical protein [Acidobacteriota bacterium]
MNGKSLPSLLLIFLFALSSVAQTTTKNLLEETNLHFFLEGEPTPQDVGFDNPKSSWKVKYELYLTDFSELEKLGICKRDEAGRHICQLVKDKKQNKQIKKKSSKISKGSFTRQLLSSEANRQVTVPVNLSPNVIEIYNQATKIPERNPTFILFVTEKVSVTNSDSSKLKEKYSITGIRNLKNAMSNQTFEYWDVKNLSLTISIVRQASGQLKLVGSRVH